MSDEKKTPGEAADPELNELLDSALEDFNAAPKTEAKKDEAPPAESKSVETVEAVEADDQWTQDFIKQAADQFERNLQNLMQNGGDGELGASFQKMAQTVAGAISGGEAGAGDGEGGADFQAAIAQALKDLSATSENLQTAGPGLSETDLAAMFGRTSMDEGPNEFLPFMQGMMQSLLSKEVLYPSLKELVDKYPAWLEEKKATLIPADLERFTKQLDLMQKVCAELEKEKEDDSDEVKKSRFETTLGLMQEMQNCGQPPEDLVGEQPPLFQFDGEGNPIMPALPPGIEAPQNCSVM